MAKFHGPIGFEEMIEERPSVFLPTMVEKTYVGDVTKDFRRLEAGSGINDDISLNNEISIIADPYAFNHFHNIRYVRWYNGYWKVTGVSNEYPRLKLTIGGVYNGPTPTT